MIAAFNLAAATVAAALALSGARATLAGTVVFAAGSLACALAPSLVFLDIARATQGVGAAVLLTGTAALIPMRTWSLAGALGFAVGPTLGGVLTQLAGWRWIFALQVPVAVLFALTLRTSRTWFGETRNQVRGLPSAVDGAVLLVSAGLVGALFLSVVLLVRAWVLTPIAAAGLLTAVPVAALAVAFVARRLPPVLDAAGGALLIAVGLALLARLDGQSIPIALAALCIAGGGVGLALGPGLAHLAPTSHAAGSSWSIAARHAGLMLGVVVIAPLLSRGLDPVRNRAIERGGSTLLRAPIPITDKFILTADLLNTIRGTPRMTLPDLGAPFARARARAASPETRQSLRVLDTQFVTILKEELTRAFRTPFAAAALLALGALPFVGLAAVLRRSAR